VEQQLVDSFGRKHDYLRVSVTDRCDLRCVYCMGPEGVTLLEHSQILSYEEIIRIIKAGAALGISKIRLTGGEPLVRKGIENLVAGIAAIDGINDLALTTNGQCLSELGASLKKAGLRRVNISLDSLRPQVYKEITRGGDLEKTLRAVRTALELGLEPVKINVVLMKDVNDGEIRDFLKLAFEYPVQLRFIEYMPLDKHDSLWAEKYLPLTEVLHTALALGTPLIETEEPGGFGPAAIYRMLGAQGSIGLIRPISGLFCQTCNRLRLTADGFLKPCLYWGEELPLRPVINDPTALSSVLGKALRVKREQHGMTAGGGISNSSDQRLTCEQQLRGMSKIGG
jgi:cyclic pyranopterin phosphate synthase